MELLSYGKKRGFITIKSKKANSKIHLVLKDQDNKTEEQTACYLKWFQKSDIVDEVNTIHDLKAILHDRSFCKHCLKIFNEEFHEYHQELELKKAFRNTNNKK